jgi:uncharacterized protein YcfL
MKKWLILFIFSVFLIGCAESVSNETVSNPDRNIIKNNYLAQKIEILDHHKRYTNGLLEVMVRIHNKTDKVQEAEYRFVWFDKDGFSIGKEPWQPITLNGFETTEISSIAHNPNAVDFKFEIRKKQ